MDFKTLTHATLLVDESKARRNIARMAEKARNAGVLYRPHLKTPQSAVVAAWYKDEGVTSGTVSSLRMAHYYAQHGWSDLTVAIPVNPREIDLLKHLQQKLTIQVTVDSFEAVKLLELEVTSRLKIWLKIDAGYNRTGVAVSDIDQIETIVTFIKRSRHLEFAGFLTHAGHSYNCRSQDEILRLHACQLTLLRPLKDFGGIVSIGDTPTCSVATDFSGIGEVRPGNLIFYDMKMVQIGACTIHDIAVCLIAPVISLQPQRKQVIVHAGSVHFSKDFYSGEKGLPVFGQIVTLSDDGWGAAVKGAHLTNLCQEHGFITAPPEWILNRRFGEFVGVLPAHSCLTVDAMGVMRSLSGEIIPVHRSQAS
jgi:D-serine deaminase-like pyridoxal phosphate-dependent protein